MISSLDISAISRALVTCPSASRPLQFTKCVFSIPRPAARSFIRFTNSSSFPHMYSAIATQASLALATAIHLSIVSTVCISPGSRNTCEPPIDAAYSETVTSSSRLMLPSARASKIRSIVMTFVTLAGGRAVSASFSNITVPVDASIRTAEGAVISTAASVCSSPAVSPVSSSVFCCSSSLSAYTGTGV